MDINTELFHIKEKDLNTIQDLQANISKAEDEIKANQALMERLEAFIN